VVGIFNKYFAANLLENLTLKICENRLRIYRLAAMSLVSPFLEHGVLLVKHVSAAICTLLTFST